VFLFPAAGWTRTARGGSGVWMLTTSEDSERPEQDGADKHEHCARRQNIELQSEIHSSHLHQSVVLEQKLAGRDDRQKQNNCCIAAGIFAH
jgi:hypothetical protein